MDEIKCACCGATEGLFRRLHSGERLCLDCVIDRVRELENENRELRRRLNALEPAPNRRVELKGWQPPATGRPEGKNPPSGGSNVVPPVYR